MREVETIDNIVSGNMKSWGHYDTFKQYWRIWGYATIVQYTARIVGNHARADGCTLMFGAGFLGLVKRLYSAEETSERRRRFKNMLKSSPHFGRRVRSSEQLLAA